MQFRRNLRRTIGLIRLTCPVCRSEFMRSQYDVNTGRAVCCSNRCTRANHEIKRLGFVPRTVT